MFHRIKSKITLQLLKEVENISPLRKSPHLTSKQQKQSFKLLPQIEQTL